MINLFLGLFSQDLAIDLGTSNTLIHIAGKGIAVREPTYVARVKKTREVIAIGTAAKKMVGRSSRAIEVVRPLRNGVVSDIDATITILTYLIKKVHSHSKVASMFPRPRVVIGVPESVTPVARRALIDALTKAGARNVYVVSEALAAAYGGSTNLNSIKGVGVIDIGGGTADLAIIASKNAVYAKSINVAGDEFDQAIVDYLRHKYSLLVGESSAEALKIGIGSAVKDKERFFTIRGRSLEERLPKSVKVSSFEICDVLVPLFNQIAREFLNLLEEAPPELLSDVSENGIILSGGGALIHGLPDYLSRKLKVSVRLSTDPLTTVVRGCAKILGE